MFCMLQILGLFSYYLQLKDLNEMVLKQTFLSHPPLVFVVFILLHHFYTFPGMCYFIGYQLTSLIWNTEVLFLQAQFLIICYDSALGFGLITSKSYRYMIVSCPHDDSPGSVDLAGDSCSSVSAGAHVTLKSLK